MALIIKNNVAAITAHCHLPETVWCKVNYANYTHLIGAVYRPPGSPPEFLEELNMFLCDHVNENTRLIMAGDFNLPHINWASFSTGHVETCSSDGLLELMFSHNLTQIVKDCTRITPTSQALLDLVFISSKVTDYAVSVEDGISDHKMVVVDVFF